MFYFTWKVDPIIHPFNWKADPINVEQWCHIIILDLFAMSARIKSAGFTQLKQLENSSMILIWTFDTHHPTCSPEVPAESECQSGWRRQSHVHAASASIHSTESQLHALEEVLFILSIWKTSLQGCDLSCWQRLWPLHHIVCEHFTYSWVVQH